MRPFVKWAGGKKQIYHDIKKKIDENINYTNRESFTLIEPFVGGGAVFLAYKPSRLIINDLNYELMTAYRQIRDNPVALMKRLDEMLLDFQSNKEEYYKQIRQLDRSQEYKDMPALDIAARMIFLNKTCFNGLYRVNSEGFFNTPMGRNNIVNLYDKKNIYAISRYLNKIPEENVMNGSYKEAMKRAMIGDILYIDPPYDYTENDGFTKYQKEGFSIEDLKELKECCDKCLEESESYVIISNNDTKKVRETFKNDNKHLYYLYYIEELDTKRMINCKGNLRNTGKEIIIVGIPCGFPQMDDMAKLIEYIKVKNQGQYIEENLLKRFKVTKKRINDALMTLLYFDLVDNNMRLTKVGHQIKQEHKNTTPSKLKEIILHKTVFKTIYEHDVLDTSHKFSIDQIADILIEEKNIMPTRLASKRAKMVRKIIDWCLAN